MSIKITTTSRGQRRLVACPAPAAETVRTEALSWLADQLQAEAVAGESHHELASRFNQIRRSGRAATKVA